MQLSAAKDDICPEADLISIEPSITQIAQLSKSADAVVECFAISYMISQDLLQIERFLWSRRASIFSALNSVVINTRKNDLFEALIMMRTAIEFISNVFYFEVRLRRIFDTYEINSNNLRIDLDSLQRYERGFHELRPILQKFTLATSIDIEDYFIESNTLMGNKKDYRKKEGEFDVKNSQTLNSVDELSGRILGIRRVYDFLSQFVHPNFGSYLLNTKEKTVVSKSREGLMVIKTTMSLAKSNYPVNEFNNLILDSYSLLTQASEYFRESTKYFQDAIIGEKKANKLIVRRVIQSNAEVFTVKDFCPCCSGKLIGQCCGFRFRNRLRPNRSCSAP